ncbi:serine hydrolase FSH [Penicillium subrubescens]|uniref:serine hydrolase FSH n=1 Tax=Penicillium subrubescens TaxID=1316194 RepID=UPI00254555DC|nr:serine hydrolase FSH [Penicillium subrubescens]KAJ5900193.1 serine hydrolase FSH [Penicillium subrubescens]
MADAKILMIHGNGQSGLFFKSKTRFLHGPLEEVFSSSFTRLTFVYPDGPTSGQDFLENTGMNDPSEAQQNDCEEEQGQDWRLWAYGDPDGRSVGFERSLRHIVDVLHREGPFIGVIGFSVGAALASMIAALLEDKRVDGLDLMVIPST